MLINSREYVNDDGRNGFRDENGAKIEVYVFTCKSTYYGKTKFHRRFYVMQKAVNCKAKGRLLQRR